MKKNTKDSSNERSANENVVMGRNAVVEAIKSKRSIENIYVKNKDSSGTLVQIQVLAKKAGIPVKEVSPTKLDFLCQNENHQGVAALLSSATYVPIEEILDYAKNKNEHPFIIIADEIVDPHNLGAIIRTAEGAGAHGIIIPKHNCAPISATAYKASAGAAAHMKIAKVVNLNRTLELLKKNNIWIYSADASGTNYSQIDYSGGVALVVGNEGSGVSNLIKQNSDFLVSIPMAGKVDCLNASVAAGIIMYTIATQRSVNNQQ